MKAQNFIDIVERRTGQKVDKDLLLKHFSAHLTYKLPNQPVTLGLKVTKPGQSGGNIQLTFKINLK